MKNQSWNFSYNALKNYIDKMELEVQLIRKLSHSGEKGREAEGILKNFLIEMLPKKVSLGTGFVVNDQDRFSNQLDIMVYDGHATPPIFAGYENSIIHIDSLFSVIETKLSYRNDDNCVYNPQYSANLVKRMSLGEEETREHIKNYDNPIYSNYDFYSKHYPYPRSELFTEQVKQFPLCALFAYSTEIADISTIIDYLNNDEKLKKPDGKPLHRGIDIICILNLGVIVWNEGRYEAYFSDVSNKYKNFSAFFYILLNFIEHKVIKKRSYFSTFFSGVSRESLEKILEKEEK